MTCTLTGVLIADGVPPTAVQFKTTAATDKWPQMGSTLPVTVDRTDLARLEVSWDLLPTHDEASLERARALVAHPERGCSCGRNPPDSSRDLAM